MNITAYSDGSAVLKFPYLGGFGIYIKTDTKQFKISKGFCNTKVGRMELQAVICCLQSIKDKTSNLTIHSDSMYVVNTCNNWIEGWKVLGFIDKKNIDLLKILHCELHLFNNRPLLKHIKGHQDQNDKNSDIKNEHIRCNEIADRLADYKRHKRYELDLPFEDLDTFEQQDFYKENGKTYYEPNRI